MDFATPYDILKHANDAFYENLQSKKWSDRKEAIGTLVELMDKNPKLSTTDMSGYHQLANELTKTLKTDANINVAAVAASALARLARGLGPAFRPFASEVLGTCLMRLKEVKPVLRDPCIECLDSCYAVTTLDVALPCIKEGLLNKAPGSKLQTCEFFTRIMLKIDLPTAKKHATATKEVVEELCKLALGSDANCREAALKSLAAFLKAVGRQAGMPLISTVAEDKLKMAKVDEYFEQFAKERPKEEPPKAAPETAAAETPTADGSARSITVAVAEDEDQSELARLRTEIATYKSHTPYDILKHAKDEFYTELQSKKWSERRDAMGNLVTIMEKNPRLVQNDSAYHQFIDEITKVLSNDANINVAASAALLLERMARGLGSGFRVHAPSVIAACLLRLKEVKAALRDPCIKCLDASYLTTNLESVLPSIKDGVVSKAPASKIQTCEFFTRIMLDVDYATAKQSAAGVKSIVDDLCKLVLGSDANCRDAASKSLAAFLKAVGKQTGTTLLSSVAEDKLKMAKINEYYDQFMAKQVAAEEKAKAEVVKQENAQNKEATRKEEPNTKQTTPELNEQPQQKQAEALPQVVETPLVRALNRASSDMVQQMRSIVSDDLASMPLESLLNLNHVYPRRMSNIPIDSVLAEQINEGELSSVDPKTVISEALVNLNSAQLVTANSAIVALMALAQDTLNQKLMADRAQAILTGIITKFEDVAQSYNGAADSEEFVCQVSNFLLKFVPQPTVANNVDKPLYKSIVNSLLNVSASCGEGNSQKSIRALLNCFGEHADVNVIIFSALEVASEYLESCLIEEANNPDFDYRRGKGGQKLHHIYLQITRVLEHCEANVERRNLLDVYGIHVAFRNFSHPIHNPSIKMPPKSNLKSSTFYVLQKFVKTTMIKSFITAIRLDEKTKHSDYVIKTHRGLLTRELSTQGEDKMEQMLCGYTDRLVKKFNDHEFKFALESMYAIHKHCSLNASWSQLKDVFLKTIRCSGFAPIIEETLEKMDEVYTKGEDLNVDDYLFSRFVTGETLKLYKMTSKLGKMLLSAPNIREMEELEFESEFVSKLREIGRDGGNTTTVGAASRLDDFGTTLQNHDPNRTITFARTPERGNQMSEEETLNLFRTVTKPKRSNVMPAVKIPAQMYDTVQRLQQQK